MHDLVVVELFDVEYYCELEMWVRGHLRSLKLVPFESLGTVSYSPSIVTMAMCIYRLRDIAYIASYWSKIAKFLYPACI